MLPDNLKSIHEEEERIRKMSLNAIREVPALVEHLNMIHFSLDTIHAFTNMTEGRTDDNLTIQLLGIRLFNSSISALNLMLSGYYQNSVTLLRDVLETGFLIDYFTIDSSMIKRWQLSNEKERQSKFSPSKIRKALDSRDNLMGKKRAEIYKLMCNYASHPTYDGFLLLAPNGRDARIGPFFHTPYLNSVLEELVKRLSPFTLAYVSHFDNLQPVFLEGKIRFMKDFASWAEKHLGIKL